MKPKDATTGTRVRLTKQPRHDSVVEVGDIGVIEVADKTRANLKMKKGDRKVTVELDGIEPI